MWRAIMMSLGLALVVLGGEAMVIDRVVLADVATSAGQQDPYGMSSPYNTSYNDFSSYNATFPGGGTPRRVFVPPEWAPWGLLSAGALTFLYATALPGGRQE